MAARRAAAAERPLGNFGRGMQFAAGGAAAVLARPTTPIMRRHWRLQRPFVQGQESHFPNIFQKIAQFCDN